LGDLIIAGLGERRRETLASERRKGSATWIRYAETLGGKAHPETAEILA
jgi:hypothetical protein